MIHFFDPAQKKPRSLRKHAVPLILMALTGLALILRTWDLNSTPPWLWWDEATQGLDARSLFGGQFRVFFPSAMGKEPLYIYLTTPFVAAWDGEPFAVRLAGALLGALMAPALYAAGRALWPKRPTIGLWSGVIAAGLWTVNFWPQSINRIGFQVNPFPLILTVAVIAWLNYTRRPTRQRAMVFGLLAGLTLTTYLAARITPLLWVLLYVALPRPKRQALRPTLLWALLIGGLIAAPLAIHFALNPGDFFQRMGGFDTLQSGAQQVTLEKIRLSVQQLVGGFLGFYGDSILRHNLPNRPPFSPVAGALFAIGAILALVAIVRRRDQGALTLLLWWLVPCIPFVASVTNAPHFPRLLGALPPALLLAALPIGWLAERLQRAGRRPLLAALGGVLALWLIVEGAQMARAYFVTWARHPGMTAAFQGDTWTFGERVAQTPGAIGVAPLEPDYGAQLDYLFPHTPIFQLPASETNVGTWLAARLSQSAGSEVMTPVWTEGANLDADARHALPFYLEREGTLQVEQALPGFDLLSVRLGERPQFDATGQRVPLNIDFPPDLTLVEGRWGAAHPNPERNGQTAAAGTPFWAVLTWRLNRSWTPRPLPDARVAVDLVDGSGHRLASAETPLMDARQKGAAAWPAGATFNTYHLIDAPATQPAGPVRLEARAYDTRSLEPILAGASKEQRSVALAQASVTPPLAPVDAAAIQIGRPLPHAFASGIELLGADAWPPTINAGQMLPLKLYWRTGKTPSTPHLSVRLGDTGISADVGVPALSPGQVVHTYADLRLPPDVPAGSYDLLLTSPDEKTPVSLGQISVANRPRLFATPAIPLPHEVTFGDAVQLLGLDALSAAMPSQTGQAVISVAAGQPITVTLAWRVLETPSRDLVRFLHVLGPDGRPVAQEDNLPCAGACSAPSWLPGEVLVDAARLTIPADLPAGTYPLAIGWYDAETFRRLPVAGMAASGQTLTADVALLPVKLVVTR